MKVKQPKQQSLNKSTAVPDFASNGGHFPSRVGSRGSSKPKNQKGC